MNSGDEGESVENVSSLSELQEMLDKSMQEYRMKNESPSESPNKKRKKMEEIEETKRKYESMMEIIRKAEDTVAALENENAILKAEIQRCEARIKVYPQTKKRYDQLSESLSKAHLLHMQANNN
jgi:chromosome segregation ATPase